MRGVRLLFTTVFTIMASESTFDRSTEGSIGDHLDLDVIHGMEDNDEDLLATVDMTDFFEDDSDDGVSISQPSTSTGNDEAPLVSDDSNVDIEVLLDGTDLSSLFEDDGRDGVSPAAVSPSVIRVNPTVPQTATDRFVGATSDVINEYSKGFTPDNTAKNTRWALNNFYEWVTWRNGKEGATDLVPSDLLENGSPVDVLETRNQKGGKYPTSTLNLLLAGIRRHMVSVNPKAPNILDEKDPTFAGLRGVRDRVARELRGDGIGTEVKHAPAISYEEEELLWSTGVIGFETPTSLLNVMFYNNGKVLMLRGGREHRLLKLSQFIFGEEVGPKGELLKYVRYIENGSKNRSGSYRDKSDNKIITQYANSGLGERCYYYIMKFYISKIPKDYKGDSFYLRPRSQKPAGQDAPWFICAPVGRNTLDGMVAKMFSAVGISGKTNHSLRVTGTTRLFTSQVPEKIVQQRTGHRLLEALRKYERTSKDQDIAVSSILSSPTAVNFSNDLAKHRPVEPVAPMIPQAREPVETSIVEPASPKKPLAKLDTNRQYMPHLHDCNNCTIKIVFKQ